jgi:hypothetical protein
MGAPTPKRCGRSPLVGDKFVVGDLLNTFCLPLGAAIRVVLPRYATVWVERDSSLCFIGEVAHIRASSPFGPRYDPAGLHDSLDNLLVLCPNCHRHIDQDVTSFPVDRLRAWLWEQRIELVRDSKK